MAIRVTMFFGVSGAGKPFGFSETHWLVDKTSINDTAVEALARELQAARMRICGANIIGNAIRISNDDVRGDSKLLLGNSILGVVPAKAPANIDATNIAQSDQPNSCIMLRLFSATGANGEQRQKAVYLAGIPDSVVVTAPAGPDFRFVKNYKTAFEAYKALLLNGSWGFLTRSLTVSKFNVADYVQEAGTGRLGFETKDVDVLPGNGTVIQIRKATLVNPALPGPNGRWTIHSKIPSSGAGVNNTYFLRNSAHVAASNVSDTTGTVEQVVPAYLAYANCQPRGQTTRKRGVGGWRPRGRSSRRKP